ncbi:MAG: response regulator [bacterium]
MKKVLIIEDEFDLLEMYKIQFEMSGMEVVIAGDPKQGFALAKREKPDVIFLDLLLSQKEISEKNNNRGGYILLDQLKSDPATKKIKVIVFSNLDTQIDRERAIQKGACAYLVKSETVPKDLVKIAQQCI